MAIKDVKRIVDRNIVDSIVLVIEKHKITALLNIIEIKLLNEIHRDTL
ncbi:hypothetical protein NADRNF5_0566 [Nitrosopumilus adriaticus]|uniref:Uncharacterized protein n=1 Tax=Nitrosopumilus adriaticus TaxID=1580092 RepID=A0A0D5C1H4_9ARCH|nr:hypothetical protein NADRNF5_0566 [Nitrosopumilus adriaticus]